MVTHLNYLYFPSTKDLTNHEVLTARAYVIMLMLLSLMKTRLNAYVLIIDTCVISFNHTSNIIDFIGGENISKEHSILSLKSILSFYVIVQTQISVLPLISKYRHARRSFFSHQLVSFRN